MADREGENMNIANMRLTFNADGGASVYKPLMPTETYHQQQQSQSATGGDIPFIQHHHHQQPQQAGSVSVNGSGDGLGESVKRKRGRPRKYGPDGSNTSTNTNTNTANNNNNTMGGGLQFASPPSANSSKKPRGRPPGSGSTRKQQHSPSLGSLGVGFTPHVITVQAGEDVLSKVMSFSQNGPRTVCILSANGTISNVTLRQAMTSGGTVTYEGRFEILSLSGSIMLTESGGQRSRTGGLSVSLAGPDGRVLGGGVAGLLTAAAPVQVIVGSFLADGRSGMQSDYYGSNSKLVGGASGVGSPSSRGNFSESSGGGASPLNQSTGNNNLPSIPTIHWKDN